MWVLLASGLSRGNASGHAVERAWPYPTRATTQPTLHLVGDSTMADKPPVVPAHPERGWGQALRARLREPARLVNHAANGRSTRRFVDEGRWSHVLGQLRAGDFVLIQFGHNDQKDDDVRRHAPAATDYSAYLRSFVAEVRDRRATPLFATPVARRKFGTDGKLVDTLEPWANAMRAVAHDKAVTLIDLSILTARRLEQLGPEDSKALFMWIQPGQWASLPLGRTDDTHYVERGAIDTAELAVNALRSQVPELRDWFD
jgi:lysophospholipase L1-like esterase